VVVSAILSYIAIFRPNDFYIINKEELLKVEARGSEKLLKRKETTDLWQLYKIPVVSS
jgi:hypothetical protein